MTHRFAAAPAAATLLLLSAGAAEAQNLACQTKTAGADWNASATVLYSAGVERIYSLKVEARGKAQALSKDNAYGWNVEMGSRDEPGGWLSLTRYQPVGDTLRAQVGVNAPQLFDFNIVMRGEGDGSILVSLRVVADGAAVLTRPAPLGPATGPWPTGVAALQRARAGDFKAVAPDNAEAVAATDRLARARKVRVDIIDKAGKVGGVMALRDGVLPEAFAAEPGLRRQAAADLAAGKCRPL